MTNKYFRCFDNYSLTWPQNYSWKSYICVWLRTVLIVLLQASFLAFDWLNRCLILGLLHEKGCYLYSYCVFYCCPMWTKYRKSTIGKVNVAFNKVFKIFMNVPSSFSPSWLFLICDVLNFPPLRRKLVLSFMKRIKKSSNVLISNSYIFLMTNFMQRYWNKLLRLWL